ncbi:uncharacterized protein J3D65DRAFT_406037 [Phyllosticta citribraziliensis]|uniref:Uncharacterized protein n=1 Tax=Phyllosticta citribraziliensis TaxID=989973 RepID=A0ABR1LN65_9PEZI
MTLVGLGSRPSAGTRMDGCQYGERVGSGSLRRRLVTGTPHLAPNSINSNECGFSLLPPRSGCPSTHEFEGRRRSLVARSTSAKPRPPSASKVQPPADAVASPAGTSSCPVQREPGHELHHVCDGDHPGPSLCIRSSGPDRDGGWDVAIRVGLLHRLVAINKTRHSNNFCLPSGAFPSPPHGQLCRLKPRPRSGPSDGLDNELPGRVQPHAHHDCLMLQDFKLRAIKSVAPSEPAIIAAEPPDYCSSLARPRPPSTTIVVQVEWCVGQDCTSLLCYFFFPGAAPP